MEPTNLEDPGSVLAAFLAEGSPPEAERLLGILLSRHAEPIINNAVWAKLGGRGPDVDRADIEDVCSDAIVAVISNIRETRSLQSREILNFRALVTVIARRCCSEFIRRRYPQFHRLRYRLRYLLEARSEFALWEDARGDWHCGLAEWKSPIHPKHAPAVSIDERALEALPYGQSEDLNGMVSAILRQAKGAIPFDDLSRLVARISGVVDDVTPLEPANDLRRDTAPAADRHLEQKQWMEWLWIEIRDLPPQQRAALLLHLRDDQGNPAIALFPVVGVTPMELAASLEMSEPEVAEIWARLPMDDLTIAARFGISRQQVINLRQSARRRLARRMETRETVRINRGGKVVLDAFRRQSG